MTYSTSEARRYRRVSFSDLNRAVVCIDCGTAVMPEFKHEHNKRHDLIAGMDETINQATATVQDMLPPF